MAYTPKILALAGSLREGSYNKKLLKIAAEGAEKKGASVTIIDLRDYPMPFMDQDIEEASGLPENAIKIKELLWEHDALLIASPEYNSSISGVLKNTIDWASRQADEKEKPLSCFRGKSAAIMSASIGVWGGLRGLVHLRAILQNIGVLVLPEQQTVPLAQEAFNEEGRLRNSGRENRIADLGGSLSDFVVQLNK